MTDWVKIGNARLACGDCLEILPELGRVDAVVDAVVTNDITCGYDRPTSREQAAGSGSDGALDGPESRNQAAVPRRGLVAEPTGETLRRDAGGASEGAGASGNTVAESWPGGAGERAVSARHGEHALSGDGREDILREMRGSERSVHSSQGRESPEQRPSESRSALYDLPQSDAQTGVVGQPQEIVLITDPPYGVNLGNHSGATEIRRGFLVKSGGYNDTTQNFDSVVVPAIFTALSLSIRGVIFCVPPNCWKFPAPDVIGGIFVSASVGRNRWGWSNFIHCLMYGAAPNLNLGAKPTGITNNAVADKSGHPTTKPTKWMEWAVDLASAPTDTILDPFMGSGTTGVACAHLGRKFIGIEIEPKYFDIACKRIEQAYAQPDLFIEPPKKPEQAKMELA